MKVMLTSALLLAMAITGSACAQTDSPAPAMPDNSPRGPNPYPDPPKDGGKDGPYDSVICAGIKARIRRLQCFRADVRNENGAWFVIYYPFP